MAFQFSVEQLDEFRVAFNLLDKDGDGVVATAELGLVLRSLGLNPPESELQRMIDDIDTDGCGVFDFPEFLALLTRSLQDKGSEGDIAETFSIFSSDGMTISREDVRKLSIAIGETLTEEDIDEMMQAAALDAEGRILLQPFVRMMRSTAVVPA